MPVFRPGPTPALRLPERRHGPLFQLEARIGLAVGLLVLVTLVAYVGRDGYRDVNEDGISLLDAFYYATVSVSTTGYGDITPESDTARLLNAVIITPARVVFLILLVGTTLEALTARSRAVVRDRLWRRTVHDHTIVCGYGTKGRRAIEILLGHDEAADHVVVVDTSNDRSGEAVDDGHAAVHGDATRAAVLERAGIREAATLIIATSRDDAAVLTTLTAKALNPDIRIIAAVREDENRHALRQSGADEVITSSSAAGRMLGFAATKPRIAELLEDLLELGSGLDLAEAEVRADDVGRSLAEIRHKAPVLAVMRDGTIHPFDHSACETLQAGDRLLTLRSNRKKKPSRDD